MARQRINEDIINSIVSSVIEENMLRKQVRKLVSEEVYRYIRQRMNEDDEKSGDDKSSNKMQATINARLKDSHILKSQLAYDLWPDMNPDNARSLFAKKQQQKDGRKWTGVEAAKLAQEINDI